MEEFDVKIENVVAFTSLGKDIPLLKLVSSVENAEYEPEQFPGLVYRINEPRVAFLLFSSGKIICTGAHNIEDVHSALRKLKSRLDEIGVEDMMPQGDKPKKAAPKKEPEEEEVQIIDEE